MIPGECRRLGFDKAVFRKFKSYTDFETALNEYCKIHKLRVTFSSNFASRYSCGMLGVSMSRMHIMSKLLDVTNYRELDEIFIAPSTRGIGYDWVGEFGTRVTDIKLSNPNLF